MAEIAVINKDNQDYDIRDKKLADASTASTVASSDAITLKTTAGTYVEIDRNSFVSAIRDVLGASITSNTGGTSDVNTLPALTSSGALKSISTSDIASVLGATIRLLPVFSKQEELANIDLNNLSVGIYFTTVSSVVATISNKPFTASNGDIFVISLIVEKCGLQICMQESTDSAGAYYRIRRYYTNTWSSWAVL